MNSTFHHIAEHPLPPFLLMRDPVVVPDAWSATLTTGGFTSATKIYELVPAETLQKVAHKLFPSYAKCLHADIPPFGKYHRFQRGHDFVVDVANTYRQHGTRAAWQHFGHIVLTDLPTKAGIPVPILSQVAKSKLMDTPVLGEMLRILGFERAWLNLSLFDSAVGGLALCGSASNLSLALAGQMPLNFGTVYSTYGSGTIELALAKTLFIASTNFNPLLWYSGLINIASGIIATWKAFLIYVSPLDLLIGTALPGALGAGLAWALSRKAEPRKRLHTTAMVAARSAASGALFTITPAFGYGALGTMIAWALGAGLARMDGHRRRRLLAVSPANIALMARLQPGGLQLLQPRSDRTFSSASVRHLLPARDEQTPMTALPKPVTSPPRPMTNPLSPLLRPLEARPVLAPRPELYLLRHPARPWRS